MNSASPKRAETAPLPRAVTPRTSPRRPATGKVATGPCPPKVIGDVARNWADKLGLASVPLFESGEIDQPETHTALLGGGPGSFALSETDEPIWRDPMAQSWTWSSNLTHHVAVGEHWVREWRWDSGRVLKFSRRDIEDDMESYYRRLNAIPAYLSPKVSRHVLELFRRLRSIMEETGVADEHCFDIFLAFLNMLLNREKCLEDGPGGEGEELLRAIPASGLDEIVRKSERCEPWESLEFIPSLALRHSGSAILQEAYFEYFRTPFPTSAYLKHNQMKISKNVVQHGIQFTPPRLARGIVEATLDRISDLLERKILTILDPACGTGTFLQESVRTLRRIGFTGHLRLIGRDITPGAVSMAGFAVERAVADWNPVGMVEVDLEVADSLEENLPAADVVLMNPPFVPWFFMKPKQRRQARRILESRKPGDVNLSMAFVTHSMNALKEGGALGTMLPMEILTLQSARQWRRKTIERGRIDILGLMGEYGIYIFSVDEVAIAVIANRDDDPNGTLRAVISGDKLRSSDNALRMMRGMGRGGPTVSPRKDKSWIIDVPRAMVNDRPIWSVIPPPLEEEISGFRERGGSTVGKLFDIGEEIVTGDDKVYLLDQDQIDALPKRERRYFRRATVNSSIQVGSVNDHCWVFHPQGISETGIPDEKALRRAVPTYLREYLEPRRKFLSRRRDRRIESEWWGLSEARLSWTLDRRPRIISGRLGGRACFALDVKAKFVTIQGFAWFPKSNERTDEMTYGDLVHAYYCLLNSRAFSKILTQYLPSTRDGKFDIDLKHVSLAIMPNLVECAKNPKTAREVSLLIELGRDRPFGDSDWVREVDRISSMLYGIDFVKEDEFCYSL